MGFHLPGPFRFQILVEKSLDLFRCKIPQKAGKKIEKLVCKNHENHMRDTTPPLVIRGLTVPDLLLVTGQKHAFRMAVNCSAVSDMLQRAAWFSFQFIPRAV